MKEKIVIRVSHEEKERFTRLTERTSFKSTAQLALHLLRGDQVKYGIERNLKTSFYKDLIALRLAFEKNDKELFRESFERLQQLISNNFQ